jgi:hypothetical protein
MRKSQRLGKNPTRVVIRAAEPQKRLCRAPFVGNFVENFVESLLTFRQSFRQRDSTGIPSMLLTQIYSTVSNQATIFPRLGNRGELWTNY